MFVYIKIHLNNKSEPAEIQYGDDTLEKFAVTERDSIYRNDISLKLMHGLIYDQENSFPEKGSQIRGHISNFDNPEIKELETISIIAFSRK